MSYYIIYQTKDGLRCFTGEKTNLLGRFIKRPYAVNGNMGVWNVEVPYSETISYREYELIDREYNPYGASYAIYMEK